MDFTLTEEQLLLKETVKRFAEKEIAPTIAEDDRRARFHPELFSKMAEIGLVGLCIPREYGGQGYDYISLAIACEELERVDTSARVLLSVHLALNSLTLLQWGTEEQKQKYLVPQARGEHLGAFGLTEPGAGSDVAGIQATAVKKGSRYILNGEKMWISLADVADTFLIFAYTDKSKRHAGMSCFIVERGFPGLSTGTIHGKLGVRAGNTGWVKLEDCEVPQENRLGQEGEGFKIAMSALDNGRYTVGAGSVGLAVACLEASIKYAKEREAFGKPIAEHQLIQEKIANMVAGIESSRLLVYRAGWMKNQGLRNTRESALCKWVATEVAFRAAHDAIQIHGAYGYSDEFPVERYFRNARGAIIYEGSHEIITLIQAQYALGYREDKPLRCELPKWEE